MANRSYLYSFKKDKKKKIDIFFDISEQSYEIPIIYKILVSSNTTIVPSKVFENGKALIGDTQEGRKRLNSFFKKLHKENIYDDKELTMLEEEFQENLNKYTLDYFLFELSEVLAMDGDDIDREIELIFTEINGYNKMIKKFFSNTKLDSDDWSVLGIDISTSLYYPLGKKEEVEKIEKQFLNKKLAKLKSDIGKKPTIKRYFSLIHELDSKSDSDEINEIVDKVRKLNPSPEQLWDCAYYYKNLDKKIALFKELQKNYPDEEKRQALKYWISNAYEDKGEYEVALNYKLEFILEEASTTKNYILSLERLMKKLSLNKQEIYQKISKQFKNQYIEFELLKIKIVNGESDSVYELFCSWDSSWKNRWEILLVWEFLRAKQLEIAFKMIEEMNAYIIAHNYYRDQTDHQKALYYLIKSQPLQNTAEVLERYYIHEEALFKDEDIDVEVLFESIYPILGDFKAESILYHAKNLMEYSRVNYLNIAKRLLDTLFEITKDEEIKNNIKKLLDKLLKNES